MRFEVIFEVTAVTAARVVVCVRYADPASPRVCSATAHACLRVSIACRRGSYADVSQRPLQYTGRPSGNRGRT
ncbi:MAG: hypothetical protein JWN13_6409 [Betaproteobacteria bacterium]|nr:hypothetical protein [Betaproteobacteria bacterium]